MTGPFRRLAACLALATFAFAQVMISAYACPKDLVSQAQAEAPAHTEGHCDDVSSANLCERHCNAGSASVAVHADVPPALDVLRLDSLAIPAPLEVAARPPWSRRVTHAGAPPPPSRPTPLRI